MSANRRFVVVMSLAVVVLGPQVASAQESPRPFPIAVGQAVTVTTEDGRKTSGRVVGRSATTVDVTEGAVTRTFAIEEVTRVQQKDSVKNGVIVGAFSLGLAGFLAGAAADAGSALGEVFGNGLGMLFGVEPQPIRSTRHHLTGAITGVAAGALLGYAIDAGKERTIYERRNLGVSVQVRPIVSVEGKGVGVQVRW